MSVKGIEKEVEEAQKGVGQMTSNSMPQPPGEDTPGLNPQGPGSTEKTSRD